MCVKGGRRCPADDSAARQARRRNSVALERHQVFYSPQNASQGLLKRDENTQATLKLTPDVDLLDAEMIIHEINLNNNKEKRIEKLKENVLQGIDHFHSVSESADMSAEEATTIMESTARKIGMFTHALAEQIHPDKVGDKVLQAHLDTEDSIVKKHIPTLQSMQKEIQQQRAHLEKMSKEEKEILKSKIKEYNGKKNILDREIKMARKEYFTKRSEAYKDALASSGVLFSHGKNINTHSMSNSAMVNHITEGMTYYPQTWVDDSNAGRGQMLILNGPSMRSGYESLKRTSVGDVYTITLGKSDDDISINDDQRMTRVATHEIAHRMEDATTWVSHMEGAFLRRRATDAGEHTASQIYPHAEEGSNKSKEIGYKDHFPNHYMGKDYGDGRHYEIFSMGMESLFHGTHGGFEGFGRMVKDEDYKYFMLGMLATSAKE